MIIIPEVSRNIQTFHGLSDPGTGARQLVGTLNLSYIFINFLKNFLYNTPNLYFQTNNICESIIYWLANRLNVVLNDPAISEDGRQFEMMSPGILNHNSAVNELIFWSSIFLVILAIGVWIYCTVKRKKKELNSAEKVSIIFCITSYTFCYIINKFI